MNEVTVHLQITDGPTYRIKGRTGRSLMHAAVTYGVEQIAADCGGCLSCATCHVIVDPAWADKLPPPKPAELDMLDSTASPREAHSRLSCQIELRDALDGLVVRVAATQY